MCPGIGNPFFSFHNGQLKIVFKAIIEVEVLLEWRASLLATESKRCLVHFILVHHHINLCKRERSLFKCDMLLLLCAFVTRAQSLGEDMNALVLLLLVVSRCLRVAGVSLVRFVLRCQTIEHTVVVFSLALGFGAGATLIDPLLFLLSLEFQFPLLNFVEEISLLLDVTLAKPLDSLQEIVIFNEPETDVFDVLITSLQTFPSWRPLDIVRYITYNI